jgi:hypothetical protein
VINVNVHFVKFVKIEEVKSMKIEPEIIKNSSVLFARI